MAENGNDCVSIGFDWHGAIKETRRIDDVDVVCITDASLFEISFLHGRNSGAVKDAYAVLRDTDYSKNLREECSEGRFVYDGAAIGFKRALVNLTHNV